MSKRLYLGKPVKDLKCAADYVKFFEGIPARYWHGGVCGGEQKCGCAHHHLRAAYPTTYIGVGLRLRSFEDQVLGQSVYWSTVNQKKGVSTKRHVVAQYKRLVAAGY